MTIESKVHLTCFIESKFDLFKLGFPKFDPSNNQSARNIKILPPIFLFKLFVLPTIVQIVPLT